MPNPNRAVVELDAMPDPRDLRTAAEQGMTLVAWRAAGKPLSKTAGTQQKPRFNPYAPYRSKWELRYSEHLELERIAGLNRGWEYETERFEIGIGATFKPDFPVRAIDGVLELHEVKGFRREAAIVRLKSAAKQYPQHRWYLVTLKAGQWVRTQIGAPR